MWRGRGLRGKGHRGNTILGHTLLGVMVVVGALLVSAAPASARLSGPCKGSGTLKSTGRTYDARAVNFVKIPRKDTVAYQGATSASGQRLAVGETAVKFPWPVGKIVLGEWGKDGKKTGSSGKTSTYDYDFPALIAGIKVPVTGYDREPGLPLCSGSVVVQIEGKSPVAWASLAFTVIALAGVSLSIRARKVGP